MAKISRPPFVNDLFAQYFSLWMGFICIFVCVLFPLTISTVQADTGRKKIAMVIMAGDSVVVARVFKEIEQLPGIAGKYSFSFYTDREIRSNRVKKGQIQESDIVLADFMNKGIVDFLASNLKKNSKVYSLRCAYLADKLKNKGINLNTQTEEYYRSATHENVKNLLFLVLSREGGKFSYGKPFLLPKSGIFHPDAPNIFSTFGEYIKWYKKSAKYNPQGFWVGIHTFSNSVLKERGKVEAYMINSLEKEGINTLSVFGRPPYHKFLEEFFLDKQGKPR
ncbi:MAG TPA: cobalt chelatase, partial [Desulfobacteraceae bacterium]|nr:cobalt chelatase [Desulfobacteraceae bacterium]